MNKKNAGFTLIELMITVILVSILTGLATTRFVQSYRARSLDHFVQEFVYFLRYIQFKSIEEGEISKLALDPESSELKSYIKLSDQDYFKEIETPFLNQFQRHSRFHFQFKNQDEIYFFPDGSVTPNQFLIMEGIDEKASIHVKNRLGTFEVVRNE